jgi:RNA polymerase sigma-70 factor (ECF subfamily)
MIDADHLSTGGRGVAQPSPTSATLIEKVKQADPQSWERLMELCRPLVLWWCRGQLPRREDVEDVVQEVFSTVFRRIPEFTKGQQPGGFRAWLKSITRFKLSEQRKRAGNRPVAAGGSEAQERFAEVPDPQADGSSADEGPPERRILLDSAMKLVRADFAPATWEAAMRTAVGGQPAAEVAAALGISPGAVYTAKSRVLARLRQELAPLLE